MTIVDITILTSILLGCKAIYFFLSGSFKTSKFILKARMSDHEIKRFNHNKLANAMGIYSIIQGTLILVLGFALHFHWLNIWLAIAIYALYYCVIAILMEIYVYRGQMFLK